MVIHWILVISMACSLVGFAPRGAAAGTRLAQASAREQAKAKKAEGDKLVRAKKTKEAEAAYKEAIKLDPDWYKSYEALGNLQFSAKRYAEAIDIFKKAVKVEPRYHTGLYNIAYAYRKARDYAKAVEYYKKYIERNDKDPDAYYGLASTYEAMDNKKEAIDAFLKYAEMEKRPSEKQYVIKARNKAEKLSKELGEQKPAVASAPAAAPAPKPADKPAPKPAVASVSDDTGKKVAGWIAEGDKAMQKGSFTKAMKHYFDAARADPRNTEAVYKLGVVYEKTGNSRAAELKWSIVLKIDPDHVMARHAIERLKAPKEAKPAAKAATAEKTVPKPAPTPGSAAKPEPVAEKPKPAPVAAKPEPKKTVFAPTGLSADERKALKKIEEGDTYFKQKAFAKAIAAYTHATQLSRNNEQALFKLGTAYAFAGNLRVAIYKWKQVLKLNPDNTAAKRNLEKAEAKLAPAPPPKAAPVEKTKAAPKPAAAPAEPKPKAAPVAAKAAPRPGSFEAWVAQAEAAKKKGDARAVLDAAEKALKVKPDAEVAILRGEALVVLKRYPEAKNAFLKAMKINPNLAAPFYGLGEACRLNGEKERARYYFKMYIHSKAKDVKQSLVQRANAFLAKG